MARWISVAQVIFLMALLGALGGELGGHLSEKHETFSVGGALAGAALVLLAVVLARLFLGTGRVDASLTLSAQRFLGFTTVFALAFFTVAALFFYFRSPWLHTLLGSLAVLGVLVVLFGLVLRLTGSFRRDA